jgi:Fe-Mn family superoxide dismutase
MTSDNFSKENIIMEHILHALPYTMDALQLHIPKDTFEYHYAKHHQSNATNISKQIKSTEFENSALKDIIKNSSGGFYNNAAQDWNHTFFGSCMRPKGGTPPSGSLATAINKKWGSYDEFKAAFQTSAMSNFGSGWTWLMKKADSSVYIVNMGTAGKPLTTGDKALLCVDVWEHAYYIDYRNQRAKFVDNIINHLEN